MKVLVIGADFEEMIVDGRTLKEGAEIALKSGLLPHVMKCDENIRYFDVSKPNTPAHHKRAIYV